MGITMNAHAQPPQSARMAKVVYVGDPRCDDALYVLGCAGGLDTNAEQRRIAADRTPSEGEGSDEHIDDG